MASTSSSINIENYSTLSSRKGLSGTGLVSGLDTESIIQAYTATTRNKITKALQDQTVATWTRDAYRTISNDMNTFYNTYFSYSSDTNILSANYWNTSSITSSSDYVTATGDSNAVSNMVIKDITRLASAANATSTHAVTSQNMTSGTISNSWVDDTISGKAMTINYGGSAYTLTVDSSFYLNSNGTDSDNMNAVVNQLNTQINNNSALKGKLAFSLDGNTVKLKQTGGSSVSDLYIKSGDSNLLAGLGMNTSTTGSTEVDGTNDYRTSAFFQNNVFAGNPLTLSLDGTSYSLSLGSDFKFSNAAMAKGADSNFTSSALALQKTELQGAYNTAISNNTNLNGKLSVSISDDMKMTLNATSASTLKVTGGNASLLTGLGLSVSDATQTTNTITGTAMDVKSALETTKNLGDTLSGTTLTFSLNGISKTISFDESSKTSFDTKEEMATYLQSKLNTAYGSNRVFVSFANDKLSFASVQKDSNGNVTAGDTSSVLSVTASSASGILSDDGALHMVMGSSNRMSLVKTISQIQGDLNTKFTTDADGKYKMTVNGKEFDFTGDTLVGDIISTINKDADAGVNISYSSVTDTFSIKADDTGSQGKIDFGNVGTSNLATALFGTKDSATDGYTVSGGSDFVADMSFDGGKTYTQVTRSTNSFEIDGVNLNFKNVDATKSATNVQFTANKNTDDLYKKMTTFIDAYNKIIKEINDQFTATKYGQDASSSDSTTKYLPLTDEQKKGMSTDEITAWETKAKTGLLSHDDMLGTILTNMRRSVGDVISGSSSALYQIGIQTTGSWTDGGLLDYDESKLKDALNKDSDSVVKMFTTTDTGVAYRLQNTIKQAAVGSDSMIYSIAGSTTSVYDRSEYSTKISDLSTQVTNLKDQLQDEEDRWWNKFTALEEALSTLNSQSQYISSITGSSSK